MLPELIYLFTGFSDRKTKAACSLVSKEFHSNVNWTKFEKIDILFHACREGLLPLLERVLPSLEFEIQNDYFNNDMALMVACERGHLDIVKRLHQDPRFDAQYILLRSIQYKHKSIAMHLLENRIDPSELSSYAAYFAAIFGYADILELILKNPDADPSIYENRAMKVAIQNHDYPVVKLLIKDGRADPSEFLEIPYTTDDPEMVILLLTDERVDLYEAIMFACLNEKVSLLEQLLLHHQPRRFSLPPPSPQASPLSPRDEPRRSSLPYHSP
jgi:hypothetical protein